MCRCVHANVHSIHYGQMKQGQTCMCIDTTRTCIYMHTHVHAQICMDTHMSSHSQHPFEYTQRRWLSAAIAAAAARTHTDQIVHELVFGHERHLLAQVVHVWTNERVGFTRVLAAFRAVVRIRRRKRLYNQVRRQICYQVQFSFTLH